jgi:aspartate-semialdehyde dehydrogenase
MCCSSTQLLRGAALNAVLIAEKLELQKLVGA